MLAIVLVMGKGRDTSLPYPWDLKSIFCLVIVVNMFYSSFCLYFIIIFEVFVERRHSRKGRVKRYISFVPRSGSQETNGWRIDI